MNLLNLGIKLYLDKIKHPKTESVYIVRKMTPFYDIWQAFPLAFLCQAMKKWNEEQGIITKNKVLKTVNDNLFIVKKILRGRTIVGQ